MINSLSTLNFENPLGIQYRVQVPYQKETGEIIEENEKIAIETNIEAHYRTRTEESALVDFKNTDTFSTTYLKAHKWSYSDTIKPGDVVDYKISLQSSKYYDYKNTIITDTLPDGMTFQSSNRTPESILQNTDGTTTIVWKVADLQADSSLEIQYFAQVNHTYIDTNPLLANDYFHNEVKVEGEWNSTQDNRTGDSVKKDSETNNTQRVNTNTTVWKEITGEWVEQTHTNKGYPVSLKVELQIPESVPAEEVLLKLYYPLFLQLDQSTAALVIENGTSSKQEVTLQSNGIAHIKIDLGSVTKGTKMTLKINGVIAQDDRLVDGTTLRTLTRATYTNHAGNQRTEVAQGTFIITHPKTTIVLNQGAKYATKDLIQKQVHVVIPDGSTTNTVRYYYSDYALNESKITDWVNWDLSKGLTQTFPDYLLNGSVDGRKEICVEVKDMKGNISEKRCDDIILDRIAPNGTVVINNGEARTDSSIIQLTIQADAQNTDDPVFFSYSTDGVSWSEYQRLSASTLEIPNVSTGITSGIAQVFVKFRDGAGNESIPAADSIIIATNQTNKIYGIEYIDISARIQNSPTLYSLQTFPRNYPGKSQITVTFDVTNTSNFVWYPDGSILNPVNISYHWLNTDTGMYYQWNGNRAMLRANVAPNAEYANVSLQVQMPDIAGNYVLQIDAVEEGITWFNTQGVSMHQIPVKITPTSSSGGSNGLPDYDGDDDFGWGGYVPISCTVDNITDVLIAPKQASNVVVTLNTGSEVTAFNYKDNFVQIQTVSNQIGWVLESALSCEKDIQQNLPVISETPVYREKAFICDTRTTILKSYPDWNAQTIGYLNLNQEIYVLEQIPDNKGNGWLQIVTVDGISGWIIDSFACVTLDGQTYNWQDYIQFERPYTDPGTDPDGNYYDIPITSDYGDRDGEYHTGVDYGLYCGTDLFAAADGVVLYTFTEGIVAGNDSTSSTPANYVVIEHTSAPNPSTGEIYKYQTRYWHLDQVSVIPGQTVTQGEKIGTSGNTGYVRGNDSSDEVGCHLHFESHRYNPDGSTYQIDPELLFQYGEIDSPIMQGLGNFGYGGPTVDFPKLTPVYRFWSNTFMSHMYTIDEGEKDYIIQNNPTWQYEGVAYYAYKPNNKPADSKPVYRFWSNKLKAHFYTINEDEKERTEDNPDWQLEGIAYYAYQMSGTQNTQPVYRFWGNLYGNHFYTIDNQEKNYLINTQSNVWTFEGVGFYAVPASAYAENYAKQRVLIHNIRFDQYKTNGVQQCGTYKYEVKWHSNNSLYADALFNPAKNDVFYIETSNNYRGIYYDQRVGGSNADIDECKVLGLPIMNKTNAAPSPQGTNGEYQEFGNGGTIYYSSKYGTNMVFGAIWKKHQASGGTYGNYGFPKGGIYWDDAQKMHCQEFEGGWLCEFEIITCTYPGELNNDRVCVKNWDKACADIGLKKYINPNNSSDITCVKINPSVYINQWLDSKGNVGPVDGWMMCGANASVMALSQQKIITENDYDELRKYVYEKDGIEIDDVRRCSSTPNMAQIEGAFSYTAIPESMGYSCNINGWDFMASYIKGAKSANNSASIKILKITPTSGDYENLSNWSKQDKLNKIKEIIDNGGGVIQGLYAPTVDGHINLIIGYSDDDLDGAPDRFIVNDSYTNLMEKGSNLKYDFSGKGAIYSYENIFNVNFTLVIGFKR